MDFCPGECRDAGKFASLCFVQTFTDSLFRIVEYATRDQAQNAVNTLSNQNLMGRLVYVREVSTTSFLMFKATKASVSFTSTALLDQQQC